MGREGEVKGRRGEGYEREEIRRGRKGKGKGRRRRGYENRKSDKVRSRRGGKGKGGEGLADSYTEEDEDTEIEYQTRYAWEGKGK